MALTKKQLEKLNEVVSKTSQILRELFKVAEDMDEKREYLEGLIIQVNKMNCLASNMRNGVVPYDSKEIKIENIKLPHWIMLKYDCAICKDADDLLKKHHVFERFETADEAIKAWNKMPDDVPGVGQDLYQCNIVKWLYSVENE